MQKSIEKAIEKGINFLSNQQDEKGSFLSLTTEKVRSFKEAKKQSSVFSTCIILSCLNSLDEFQNSRNLERMRQRAANFLLSQKSEHWSFNYWTRESQESKINPYPEDLDDTFFALSALWRYKAELVNADALAKAVTLLTLTEAKEGGPYQTWIVPPDADKEWKDIDLAVNSNVAYFLSLQGVSLKNISFFIESAIAKKNISSPYYSTPYSVIYFISRFYNGKKKEELVRMILEKEKKNHSWGSVLDTSLAVSSLINLGFSADKLKKSIKYILSQQKREKWEAYPLVVEKVIQGKKCQSGSQEITTAFCLETLQKFVTAQSDLKENSEVKDISRNRKRQQIYEDILGLFEKRMLKLGKKFEKKATKYLFDLIKKGNREDVALLSYFFNEALGENRKKVPREILVKLGLVNLYGWLAYTIYDDFLDEDGRPETLPVANVCLRELTIILSNISEKIKKENFTEFFEKIIDRVEKANIWEVTECRVKVENRKVTIPNRLPNYESYQKLAERSIGHALGPLVILFFLGFKSNSSEIKNTLEFFEHFIIARQMSDDMHDWEEDLEKGHLSSVVVALLKVWREKRKSRKINPKKDMEKFQEIFWYKVVVDVCNQLLKHTEKAKKALMKVKPVCNPEVFNQKISAIEQMARKTLREQKETINFLKSYGK